jgi:hypothetical protein
MGSGRLQGAIGECHGRKPIINDVIQEESMPTKSESVTDPVFHTKRIRQMLLDVADHARDDVDEVNEPRAQALFETTAEALEGLARAYEHYEEGKETAWKRD